MVRTLFRSITSWFAALTVLVAVMVMGYAVSQRFQILLVQDQDQLVAPPTSVAQPVGPQSESPRELPKSERVLREQLVEPSPPTNTGNSVASPAMNPVVSIEPSPDPDLDPDGQQAFQAMTDVKSTPADSVPAASDREPSIRTWTDWRGKFSVRAKLIKQTRRSITLERVDDGKQIAILIRRLSKADQDYLATLDRQASNPTTSVAPTDNPAQVLEGRVVRVSDGDTIDVVDPNFGEQRIRLEGIDAPEYSQPYGREARKWLASRIAGKTVRVVIVEKDRYDRWAGHVYLGDNWINQLLVIHGWAWHYQHFSDDPRLATAHQQARAKRLGLWQDPQPIAPWKYREQQEATVGFEPTNR